MTRLNLFKRRKPDSKDTRIPHPHGIPEATSRDDYMLRGWYYYSRKMNTEAEADFQEVLALDPENVDANYSLGLVFKVQGMNEKAVEYFNRAIALIEEGFIKEKARAEMLRRLSSGHINELTEGDWKLEEEIWQHKG
ncbi:MAG: tetratricopeptide repeat protein [Anaerolineales bacterium]